MTSMGPSDSTLSPDDLVGRTLIDVWVSKTPLGGEQLPGLGRPLFYDVVLVLDGGARYWLLGDQLELWTNADGLEPLKPALFGIDSQIELRGCPVTGVSSDEDGDLMLELDGRMTLQVLTDHGTQILISPAR